MPDLVVNKNEKSDVIVKPTILDKSIENETNILEMKVIPDKPKTLNNEQIEVYIPVASYTTPGVIAFDERYFIINSETGKVIPRYVNGGNGENNSTPPYILEVSSESDAWKIYNEKGNPYGGPQYCINILQVEHSFKKIYDIIVECKDVSTDILYENIIYSYKRFKSGTVTIILDKKINCRILIKGE